MACTCVKKELGTGQGKVKGYVVENLCVECVAQQVTDAAVYAEQKKETDANDLISKRVRDDAKVVLINEGKIEEIDGTVKVKN